MVKYAKVTVASTLGQKVRLSEAVNVEGAKVMLN
jgi:hypothetical protein